MVIPTSAMLAQRTGPFSTNRIIVCSAAHQCNTEDLVENRFSKLRAEEDEEFGVKKR